MVATLVIINVCKYYYMWIYGEVEKVRKNLLKSMTQIETWKGLGSTHGLWLRCVIWNRSTKKEYKRNPESNLQRRNLQWECGNVT